MGNYYLYLFGQFITRLLPIRWSYALACFISDLHYLLSKADRQAVEANLKVILKVEQVDPAQVREVFHNFGKYLVDFLTMTKRLTSAYMQTHLEVSAVGHVNTVLQQHKGGIVISAHLGNWEMGAVLLPMMGYPISMIALPHKDPRVNLFFNQQREFFGTQVVPTTVAVRRCMEHLKRNRLVAMLVERDFSQHGLVMDFLGKPTMIPKGAALFSLKTGAPIIPCFFIRKQDDYFDVNFHSPIYPPVVQGDITEEVLRAYIKQYLVVIEAHIRQYPSQWLMFREFWVK